jgi:uncharacterized membrane protein YbhN (UPF0104 family)
VAIHQRARVSRFEALATVMVERIYDVVSLVLLLFVALPFLPRVSWLRGVALVGFAVVALALLVVVLVVRFGDRPARLLLRPLALLPRVSQEHTDLAATNLVNGLAAVRDLRLALTAMTLTTASWLVFVLSYWFLMQGTHLGLGVGAALVVLVTTNFAMILPSSPAAVGVFEAATQVALAAYGTGSSSALAYGVVLHLVNVIPYVVAGIYVLNRRSGWRALRPDIEP